MTPGGGNAYLGDGFAEEISSQLAQIPGLRVAARTSAFEFKDRNLDVRRIGEALGVHHVLEGSIRRDGDNLRVTVQLINASNGYHVWAGTYDEKWADAIAVQDDICEKDCTGTRGGPDAGRARTGCGAQGSRASMPTTATWPAYRRCTLPAT